MYRSYFTKFTATSRGFGCGFEGPPSHLRAFLCEYRDSSFLLRCCGTRREYPLMPSRGPPLDRRGGVITIGVKDIPIGAYGLDGVCNIPLS